MGMQSLSLIAYASYSSVLNPCHLPIKFSEHSVIVFFAFVYLFSKIDGRSKRPVPIKVLTHPHQGFSVTSSIQYQIGMYMQRVSYIPSSFNCLRIWGMQVTATSSPHYFEIINLIYHCFLETMYKMSCRN